MKLQPLPRVRLNAPQSRFIRRIVLENFSRKDRRKYRTVELWISDVETSDPGGGQSVILDLAPQR